MLFYALTIFVSAFLLFQVQPIIAKAILPWFGGTSTVWSTCMLFFQAVLLFGYGYAHWLHRKMRGRRQALVHMAALGVSLLALPILPNPWWKSAGPVHPSLRILELLTVTVGPPYFLLSSTSPLLQAWYARTHERGLPYRLFALSNLASMLALLSYPALIEPYLATHTQGLVWSAAYACFAVLCGVTAWRSCAQPAALPAQLAEDAAGDPAPGWTERLLWVGLACSASVLLLAVTTHLTQDVAAIPFLWILPLSVYLLSFIICFDAPRWYRRAIFVPLLVAALGFMAYRLWPDRASMPLRAAIICFAAALFVSCMVCHGELARLKPHPRHLTAYYVAVSLGGAIGGLFVGLIAPNLFRAYYEFPIGLGLCAVLAVVVLGRGARRVTLVATAVLLCGYLGFLEEAMRRMSEGYRVVARNFYGQLRVSDEGDPAEYEDAIRRFIHGTIDHGEQSLVEEYRRTPITYFCKDSGIGRAMRATQEAPRRIGILGLGAGTLAAYGKPGDLMRIYEINPLVLDIASNEFTYLRDTPAKVEVALGDGRLVLESEPPQHFDMLVMDAFSGDSVPVHLITREAFQTYFRHMKPGGILAVNISNKYLNLEPVIARAAEAFGRVALVYHFTPPEGDFLCLSCSWTLIMERVTVAAHPELLQKAQVLRCEKPLRMWTDDYSNLLGILK